MMPLKDLDLGNLNELPFFFPVLRKRGHCFDVKNGLLLIRSLLKMWDLRVVFLHFFIIVRRVIPNFKYTCAICLDMTLLQLKGFKFLSWVPNPLG